MDIKELTANYQTVISIVFFVASLVGLYWKLKMEFSTGMANVMLEITKINKSIKDIEVDRAERWDNQAAKCFDRKTDYDRVLKLQKEKDEKTEAYLADIAKGVNELKTTIEGIKKDVEWLKKGR